MATIDSDAELDAAIVDNLGIGANLEVIEKHLKVYMPCFVGRFLPGDFKHLDTHKKKSMTRQRDRVRHSAISNKPISYHDIRIEASLQDESFGSFLSFSLEDALDLNLCMAFDILDQD